MGLADAPAAEIAAARDTAMNPAVLDAFAMASSQRGNPRRCRVRAATHPALAREQAAKVGMAMEELCRAMPPRAGACVSACSRFQKGWQQSFWGPHSPRLAALKR